MSHFKTVDRTAEVKKLALTYPDTMQELAALYTNHKAHFLTNHKAHFLADRTLIIESTTRAKDLGTRFCSFQDNKQKIDAYQNTRGVIDHFKTEVNGGASGHIGVSASDFSKELNGTSHNFQKNMEDAREELAKTGLKEALEESLTGVKKKRKRCLSEYDGDYDHDRRWDIAPFSSTSLAAKEFPYLELIFPIGMNSRATKEAITLFSTRCLALAEVLEHAGYRIAITGECWGIDRLNRARLSLREVVEKNFDKNMPNYSKIISLNRIIFQEGNEYGNIQDFAAYSSSEFFRRTIFALNFATGNYVHGMSKDLKNKPNNTYGISLTERPLPAEPGQLVLTQELIGAIFSTDKEMRDRMFKERIIHTLKIA